ncbi:MBL fold metallo-hydrolase [Myceligenerans xiligouense]|uniref:Glyoxylase-like metal-dependent hydrolase (Beta-lactamase superfamily II) n=1 Tax=Myceligenerans xiligouense TaxID=253184 RepID=A0A3N4YHZ9_9MICO|nr:MBL fold metallo-hydrolase [Myceligenerans xiligouense]RPF20739.1 glyoxylase-like metal-dependent hydrolase (beta-lactamase superfamily II) [Myceligenerans xiligouense]
MLVETALAEAFGTKAYVVSGAHQNDCVIVDPGIRAAAGIDRIVRDNGLNPTAVLLTHGHLDHTHDAPRVCDTYGVPAYIHDADLPFLADPFSGLGSFAPQFEAAVGPGWEWTLPHTVRHLRDGDRLDLAGVPIRVDHAPGHTPGSVLFTLEETDEHQPCLVGDVVYAGTIGTTLMPGGDRLTTLRSIRDRILTRPDETVLLTAHKQDTTVGREREANPFFRQAVDLPPEPWERIDPQETDAPGAPTNPTAHPRTTRGTGATHE